MDTLHVLVTDDEPGMRLGVVRTLRDFKVYVPDVDDDVAFTVEQAASGEEALEVIRRRAPDILLLDLKMPGISGLEVLDRTAAMGLDMLTIMITAYASVETAVLATRRGAYEFLAKPFTPAELRATLQKAAARQVLTRRARRLADEKRQVRFEFVRVLGHELKAPLNAVTGYLDMVRSRQLGDDLGAYEEILGRSALRIEGMRRLIGDLLDLTRIESGQKSRRLEPVDLRAAGQAAIDGQLAAAGARGITLVLDAEGPLPIRADPGEIDMILNNLVSNAVKYNREQGEVRVTLRRDGTRVRVAVADTGIGMSPASLGKIFDEFVRIRTTETAHIEGSGLGLSIVKKLAQLYGGSVAAESEPGRGTTITVTLAAGGDEPRGLAPA
jgi:signal transduction histidine kinase